MTKTIIWHNPRCSKSRQTLALLEARGGELEVREYMTDTPNISELRDVMAKLGYSSAHEWLRKNELRLMANAASPMGNLHPQ